MAYHDELVRLVKGIVRDYLANEQMADTVYATYTGSGLKIDNKPVPVDLDMVDIPAHLGTMQATLSLDIDKGFAIEAKDEDDRPITIERIKLTNVPITLQVGLVAGDRVAVVQKRGGQKYAVVGKV